MHLAALDIPIPVIMVPARWGSAVVMRYVADSPLTALTRLYVEKAKAASAAALADSPEANASSGCASSSTAVQAPLPTMDATPILPPPLDTF